MPVQCTCSTCGAVFARTASDVTERVYCSIPCFAIAQKARRLACICRACGKEFRRKPSMVSSENRHYCSATCWRSGRPAVIQEDGLTAALPLCARDASVVAYALIDATDAAWASQWRWHLDPSGYALRNEWTDGRRCRGIRLHREIMGLPREDDGRTVDHIDRDRLNNRKENLRIVTYAENGQNVTPSAGCSSVYRGVCWIKARRKWSAYVTVKGKRQHLGYFASEVDASEVAKAARLRLLPCAID
jgi:hypothetical protein